ncbi:MAG: hypothetical protein V3U80_03160 [Flavobacteriaceae bacterium]
MKTKITKLMLLLFLISGMNTLNAQDKFGSDPDNCKMNLSLFHESVKAKAFADAMVSWKFCYDNCPKASLHIYSDGLKIAKNLIDTGDTSGIALTNEIYTKRIENYPTKNLGKTYSDWAKFLAANGGTEEEVFEKLNLAFESDPAGMSVKNIFKFFQTVMSKYKDTDTQKVFTTMDRVLEAVDVKIGTLSKGHAKLQAKVTNGESLSKKEQRRVDKQYFEKNLSGLGMIQGGLDGMVESIATCERLIPLYKKSYDSNKTNVEWLKRTAKRLNRKGCKTDPFFVTLIENWSQLEPSVTVLEYLESIYRTTGRTGEADTLAARIFEMASPQEKARFYYSQAQDLQRAGKYSAARTKAREALTFDPSYGRAYILIGTLYASSADKVGTDQFSKRMVYVAAAAKMRQAMKVDPSLSSTCNKYLKNYRSYYPTTKFLFTHGKKSGASHRVGGWIGETVRIP